MMFESIPLSGGVLSILFLHTQPAHLQRHIGKSLAGDARKAARAELVRGRIGKNNL